MTHILPSESITSLKQINGVQSAQVVLLLMYYLMGTNVHYVCVTKFKPKYSLHSDVLKRVYNVKQLNCWSLNLIIVIF